MHGRVKVKTTAEQEEERRKEREKKLEIYKAAICRVVEKRQNGELDDEVLQITAQVLQSNPDDSTLWNIRREVLGKLRGSGLKHSVEDGAAELTLTELALSKNPKSYGAWSHRAWSMDFFQNMDWTKELHLCDLFLKQDERNFHAWDYRRLVCGRARVTLDAELSFTMDKIAANFSNYSAWHYRSSLLPKVYPGEKEGMVREDVLLQEYDLVQNATFTDPSDQSAWFYHRWLTGRGKPPLDFLLLHLSRETGRMIAHFTQQIRLEETELILTLNSAMVSLKWKAPEMLLSSSLWYASIPESLLMTSLDCRLEAKTKSGCQAQASLHLGASDREARFTGSIPRCQLFSCELSATRTSVLEEELRCCQQLKGLEPQNKWPILSCVLLMRALDGLKFEAEIEALLSNLSTVDPMRRAYYHDLRSKFAAERVIEKLDGKEEAVSLAAKDLTSIRHTDHLSLVRELDLSRNRITSLRPLCYLISLRGLVLDGNDVETCDGLGTLPDLTFLSLRNNKIASVNALAPLKTCSKLTVLNLDGNPMRSQAEEVLSFLPQVKALDLAPAS